MNENQYLEDLKEIRDLMHRSSQFVSLSGKSGIFAGIYALAGSVWACFLLRNLRHTPFSPYEPIIFKLFLIALLVAVVALLTSYMFTSKKAKQNNEQIRSHIFGRLALNFLIPFVTGGILCLILLFIHHTYLLLASTMLIFYGLSCVNCSKFTHRDIRYFGIAEIVVGLLAAIFPAYSLYFWAFGFGILHIVYGIVMYMKYDRK